MARFEFSEGRSNKFWDIKLTGKSFTTTYGRIGSSGQTTIKKFKTDADAKKEHDKLVAEKTKKGYKLVGGKAKAGKANGKAAKSNSKAAKGNSKAALALVNESVGKRDARNKDLEAAILANPLDRDAYGVLADWLQEQGDPRGELIALQLGYKDKQAKALIEKHADYFLGPLAAHQTVYDDNGSNGNSRLRSGEQDKEWEKTADQAFLWRNGFIYRVRLSHNEYFRERPHIRAFAAAKGKIVDILDQVFRHPSGRYVVELAFQANGEPHQSLQDVIDLIGKKAPPTIRKITFGDNVDQISWHETGKLGKLWKGVPNLRALELQTGKFDVGKMNAPALERAIFITGGLSKAAGKNIANAVMPKIRHLEIYYGDRYYGGDCTVKEVKPLLARTDLKHLQYLGLKNSEFADDLAREIAGGAKIVKGLKTLDLSDGTMTDEGAQALAAAKDQLKHLEVLDLRRNFLTKDGIKAVKGICRKVLTDFQDEPHEDGEELHYYVSIGE